MKYPEEGALNAFSGLNLKQTIVSCCLDLHQCWQNKKSWEEIAVSCNLNIHECWHKGDSGKGGIQKYLKISHNGGGYKLMTDFINEIRNYNSKKNSL
jgi:hypothetical protein